MGYLKYTPYIYLIFALYFMYEGIVKWGDTETGPWLSFMIAGLAIFMFFFRRKFANKMRDRNSKM